MRRTAALALCTAGVLEGFPALTFSRVHGFLRFLPLQGSERVFQELKAAHDTLMDGASREAYDRCLQQVG